MSGHTVRHLLLQLGRRCGLACVGCRAWQTTTRVPRRRRAPCLSEVRANRLQVRSRLRRRHRRGENNVFNELPMSGTKQRHRERLNARHRRGQRVPDKHTPPIVTTARLISVTDILVVIS